MGAFSEMEIGGGQRLKAVYVVKSQGRASGFQGGPMPHLKATLIHDKQTSRHLPNIHKTTQHNSMTPEEDFFQLPQVGLETTTLCSLDRVLYSY